jgi:hypothetical protein
VAISSHDMKVWLGNVLMPGHIQLVCCALGRENLRGGERVDRCEKEIYIQGDVCMSLLSTSVCMCIHCADSVD